MNAEDIKVMQEVAQRSDRAHMLKFLAEKESFIRSAMNKIDEEEMLSEDYEIEELIALSRY